jgi:hypothetical protein
MARRHRSGKLPKKNVKSKAEAFPVVILDAENDFASIRLSKGIEKCSYEKDGILFSENAKGQVIEIQILNVSKLKPRPRKSA